MESEVIKKFNEQLTSIHECKAPSKNKINEITKAALKAKSLYKHVVFSIEKFLTKCKKEHRLHVLYIVDSIIRTSKHQFKERDVFAPRFLKSFDKMLRFLLDCKQSEQLKVVRTLNLWLANKVYTLEEIEPFRTICKNAGIQVDFETVEKAVKGSSANMRRYDGSYDKKNKKETQPNRSTTPPGIQGHNGDGLMGAAPGIPHHQSMKVEPPAVFEPSDELLDGVISQKELLQLFRQAGLERFAYFEHDPILLSRAHSLMVTNLKSRALFVISQSKFAKRNSIKNVLTADFEYSDDEEEKEKEPEPEDIRDLAHTTVLDMAAELMKNEVVLDGLLTLIQEKQSMFTHAPPPTQLRPPMSVAGQPGPQVSQPQFNLMNLGAPGQPNLAALSNLPPGLAANLNSQLLQNAQMNPVFQQAIQQGRLAGLPPPQNAALNLAQLQALQNIPPNQRNMLGLSNLLGNPLLSQLTQMGQGLPQGLAGLAGLGGPPTSMSSNGNGQITLPSMGVPPPMLPTAGSDLTRHLQQFQEEEEAARRQLAMLEDEEKLKEEDSRSRERERTAKRDRDRSRERERKKIGLPSLKNGITFIASRTLWLKKVPTNCSENDLKVAVEPCGESRGIRIIANRACAYVTMETRKAAYDVVNRLKEVVVLKKTVKVYWARGPGMNEDIFTEMWDIERGVLAVPHDKLPKDLEKLCEGSLLDLDSLPESKKVFYDEQGKWKVAPKAPAPIAPPVSNTVPSSLPPGVPPAFSFPGLPSHLGQGPLPPGIPPQMFNKAPMPNSIMPVPPPPGMGAGPPRFPQMPGPPAPPGPPGLPAGFDMNRPPPVRPYDAPPPPGTGPPMMPPSPYGRGAPPPMGMPPGGVGGVGAGGGPSYGRGAPGPPSAFRGRGGFEGSGMRRGGYEGGRGGMHGGMPPPPQMQRSRYNGGENEDGGRRDWQDERRGRDGGAERWQSRERERSPDRRRNDGDNDRRRSSRWGRDDGGDDRREDRYSRDRRVSPDRDRERERDRDRDRSHRRDRDHSRERRSTRETRRTPEYEEDEGKKKIESLPPVEGMPLPADTKTVTIHNADDEIVSSTTLDDVRPGSNGAKHSEAGIPAANLTSSEDAVDLAEKAITVDASDEPITMKIEEQTVVISNPHHAESMEEVPMDLE